jgi:VRR-NUC domain-containing protein
MKTAHRHSHAATAGDGEAQPMRPAHEWTDLSEKHVARQASEFLQWRGWRRLRNQSGVSSNQAGTVFRYGEKGMADLLFVRYLQRQPHALVLWVETKAPKRKLSADQVRWQENERERGAMVVTVYCYEQFAEWYENVLGWVDTDHEYVSGNLRLDFNRNGEK